MSRIRIQLDKQWGQSKDARLVAWVIINCRRLLFWLAGRWGPVALAGVLIWLAWLVGGWR